MADPCMMLAWIFRKLDTSLLNLVQCEWSLKKASIQLCMFSGIVSISVGVHGAECCRMP